MLVIIIIAVWSCWLPWAVCGAWFFMLKGGGSDADHGKAEKKAAKAQSGKTGSSCRSNAFTVNLQPENGDQYLQMAVHPAGGRREAQVEH